MLETIMRGAMAAVFASVVTILPAKGIDLTGRDVPFVVTENSILSGTLENRFLPGGKSLQVKPTLGDDLSQAGYALFVPGNSETTITVNGDEIFIVPLQRRDGLVYSLDRRHLKPGENLVRIDRAESAPWAGMAMFAVNEGYEEVHFAETFGDPADGMPFSTREAPVSSLQEDYDVLWYDCTWKPNMYTSYMEQGSQVIMGAKSLVNNLQVVEIDFDMNPSGNGGSPMTIDYIDSGAGTGGLTYSYVHNDLTPRLRITLPAPANTGDEFFIRIGYHGAPNDNPPKKIFGQSALQARSQSDSGYPTRPVVYSVSQPYGARRWWPCKDHPSDKPTTTIQRVIVPKTTGYDLTAVSNGVLDPVIDHGSTREYVWRNDHPIATYLMSIAISEYLYRGGTYTSRDGTTQMPVGSYIYPPDDNFEGQGYLGTIQVMNFFADLFGEYPFLDQKYVTAAWNIGWAIEHQTATSTTGGSSTGLADGLTRRNVHELAHQWFGNKLTTANWDHLWLNEGFATYSEALFFGNLSGQWRYHSVMNGLSPSNDTPVIGPTTDNFAGSVAYDRGAWVLHMLRYYLGDDAFFQVLRDYAAKDNDSVLSQPGGNASLDFQTVVEESAGLAPGSMAPFFTQWLYSPNANYDDRPRYSYAAAYDIETSSVQVSVKQTQPGNAFQMPVPVGLTSLDSQTTVVHMPAGQSQVTVAMGDFVPVSSELDPDNWVLNRQSASILTVNLPPAVINETYSFALQADSSSNRSWQKLSNSPSWLTLSSSGFLSGTPPAAGVYSLSVRLIDSNNPARYVDAEYDIVVGAGIPTPAVVINELLYNNQDGSDNAEYVELHNTSAESVDIGLWQLHLVSGFSGNPYATVVIPGGTIIGPGDYYVLGNASAINAVYPGAVDLNTSWNESITDSRGAVVLQTDLGIRVDSLTYGADDFSGGGSHGAMALAEGGTGRAISAAITNTAENAVLGRLPNGVDTGSNLQDFAMIPPSPGSANSSGVTLPFFDNFNSGARPEWRPAYDNPVRTASPGQTGKPPVAAPSPAGGSFLEVYDNTGGGDVVYLPGDFDKLNVEGYIWIPRTDNSIPWSTGIGIATRVESAWFSYSSGYALENGFYLEYQNGTGIGMKNGLIPDISARARLIAVDSSGSPGTGFNAFTATIPGTPAAPTPSAWHRFRMFVDTPADRLYAQLGDHVIYDGTIPPGNFNTSGGLTIGFRENHSGNNYVTNSEGTWVDDILVNTDTTLNSQVTDFELYD